MNYKRFITVFFIGIFTIYSVSAFFKNVETSESAASTGAVFSTLGVIYDNNAFNSDYLTLQTIYDSGENNEVFSDCAEIAGGGYVLIGYGYNLSFYRFVRIYDNNNGLLFAFEPVIESFETAAADDKGYYYLAGSINEGADNFAYLAKYKDDEKIWGVKLDSSGRNSYSKIVITDNSVVVAGFENYMPGKLDWGNANGIIAEYDFEGNLIKSKKFGGYSSDTRFTNIKKTQDGFVITGYSKSQLAPWYVSAHANYAGIVLKLDNNFNLQWSKLIGTATEYIYALEILKDGSIVLGGNTNTAAFYTCDMKYADKTTGYTNGFIAKLSSDGIIDDIQVYGYNISGLAATEDGGFFAIVNTVTSNGLWQNYDTALTNKTYDNIVLRFNKNFKLFYVNNIGGEKDDNINYIQKFHDNTYRLIGGSNSSNSVWSVASGFSAGIVLILTDLNAGISFSDDTFELDIFNPYFIEGSTVKSIKYFVVNYTDTYNYESNFAYGYIKSGLKDEIDAENDGADSRYILDINENCMVWYEVVYELNGAEISFVKQYKIDNFLTPVTITVKCYNGGELLNTYTIENAASFIYDLDGTHIFTIANGIKYNASDDVSITVKVKDISGYSADENIIIKVNKENITTDVFYAAKEPDKTPNQPDGTSDKKPDKIFSIFNIILLCCVGSVFIAIITILIIVLTKKPNKKI